MLFDLERWNSLSAYNIAFRSAQHQRATWYLRASVSLPARAGERDARQRQYRPIATSRLGMTIVVHVKLSFNNFSEQARVT